MTPSVRLLQHLASLLVGLYFGSYQANAQNHKIDSLQLVLDTISKKNERYVQTLWEAADLAVKVNRKQSAVFAYEAYEVCNVRFPTLKSLAALKFTNYLMVTSLLDSAEQLLNTHATLYPSRVDSEVLAMYYLMRGQLASSRTQMEKAGSYYDSALATAQNLGDIKLIGLTLHKKGAMFHYLHQDSTALDYYGQALGIYKRINRVSGASSIYSNMASIHGYLGNYHEADAYRDSSIWIDEQHGYTESLIVNYGNAVINIIKRKGGKTSLRKEDITKAKYYLTKMDAIAHKTEDAMQIGYMANVKARFYVETGDFRSGWESALVANKIGKESKIQPVLANSYGLLIKATVGMKNYENAYLYQKELNDFYDSIQQVEQELVLLDLNTKYETEKKEAENQRLLLANQQQVVLNRILIGGGVLLFLLLASLFYFYRGKQKVNRKLEVQKRQIESSLREKDALLREIHHRVKNNLQVISSLLNMQSHHLQDSEMINAIAEGQSRVKAMALIHQKLYQTEQLSEIDFQEYTEQLVNHLAAAFGQPGKKISCEVSGVNIKLDIDTAIPLGLILNELITNAYKYAFRDVTEGDLKIEMHKEDEWYYNLTVMDNGQGLPLDFDESKLNSLGLKLVRMLIEQLDGSLTIQSDQGTRFLIRFKEAKMSA